MYKEYPHASGHKPIINSEIRSDFLYGLSIIAHQMTTAPCSKPSHASHGQRQDTGLKGTQAWKSMEIPVFL